MSETNQNVWAPWRMEYIQDLNARPGDGDCFLCRYAESFPYDQQHHVLWRSERTLTLLNRYPYTNGHLLLAPIIHRGDLEQLPEDVAVELTMRIRDAIRVLQRVLKPQGFNVGMNLGRCAGAGLPEHAHWHIVPRWNGDTNFMAVTGQVRVIPQTLETVAKQFRVAAGELGLPNE